MSKSVFRKVTILVTVGYLGLIALFIANLVKLPEQSNQVQGDYILEVEQELKTLFDSDIEQMPGKAAKLVKQYPMELVIHDSEWNIIFKTLPFTSNSYMGSIQPEATLSEAQGSHENSGQTLHFWYNLYHYSNDYYLEPYLVKQSLILGAAFIFATIGLCIIGKSLFTPLLKVQDSVSKLEKYDFKNIHGSDDNVNQQLEAFAKRLEDNIHAVSRKHTVLEQRLQLEKDRLQNTMVVSRSFIHDLKTPVHQTILENDYAYMHNKMDAEQLAQMNIQMNEKLIKRINEILAIMKRDFYDVQAEVTQVDVVSMLLDTIKVFSKLLVEKDFLLDLSVPNALILTCNRATLQLLIHNLISNMTSYARKGSSLSIRVEQRAGKIYLYFENESDAVNIERMKNSEQLFNAIQMESNEDNSYSSGNGLFLIKDLALLLGGEYKLKVKQGRVRICIVIGADEKSRSGEEA